MSKFDLESGLSLDQRLREQGPMNLEQAYETLERLQLDGMVLAEPVNVFHLLGYWPQLALTRAGQPPTTFALLTRDQRQSPGFVTSRFIYYYTYVDGGFTRDLQVHLYLEADDDPNKALAPAEVDSTKEFPDLQAAPLSDIERDRRAALDAAQLARATHANAGAALMRAMQAMGLDRGRIAFDHPLIEAIGIRHGHRGTFVPADQALGWIRLVKSPLELELMRRASRANVAAVLAVAQEIRAGATYHELRERFACEAAARGNRAVFLTLDRVSSELSAHRVADGQTFFIDGVSHHRHYHGDYARTVFVGEPHAAARTAARAVTHAWRAIRERLKPGLKYSDIVNIGKESIKKGGFDVLVGFGPHSVGLAHTDEPGADAGGFHRKLDLTLQENMVLSVDCPVMNTGIGGSAHVEDLMLITADGAEPLHDIDESILSI